jgi:2-polyprenyl-3-methyl-5-hydroxy-6-metoxy-1,4-benzoquinol methylase
MKQACPCCNAAKTKHLIEVSGYNYFKCLKCGSLFLDTAYLEKIDAGLSIVKYEEGYWKMELESARERSYGAALARTAEALYYCRIPVKKFLDIGSGPGYFLDAIGKLLPDHADTFYGVELFPPEIEFRSKAPNYMIGDLGDLQDKFDCGICVEVIEHLTPRMLDDILKKLAAVSNPGALYIFNTGLPEYVIKEDIKYLDPTSRGHLVSYSLEAVSLIAGKYGFAVHPIKGKTWAFALELSGKRGVQGEDIRNRIWSALPENINLLVDKNMGSVMKVLGLDTVRAYN